MSSTAGRYARHVIAMDDDELEEFVLDWLNYKTAAYASQERFSGPGDMGRDVVGYCSEHRMEGPWDNYQCKQLKKRLTEPDAIRELGKIFFHSSQGAYALPAKYVFIAPRGVTRTIKNLIAHPNRFRARVLEAWDDLCASTITSSASVPLTDEIHAIIATFDFSSIDAFDAARLIKDDCILPVLVDWFDEDPGPAPMGVTPNAIQPEEAPFLLQLLDAYSEKAGSVFAAAEDVLADARWGQHLQMQRKRFFEAAAFKRYYRDNTPVHYLRTLEDDIYSGVFEVHLNQYPQLLDRVDKVLLEAAQVSPAGILGRYARVPVKQGICHHFANDGRWSWLP